MASCAWSGDDTAVNEALGQASRSTWSGKAEFGSGCSRIRLCGELGKLLVSYLDQVAGSSRISRSPQKQQFLSPRTSCLPFVFRFALGATRVLV